MLVYHFLPARWACEDLERRRLKIALVDELNDPFELMCYELSTPVDRQVFNRWKDDTARRYGLLCFSRDWTHPLLWSHYGDRHKGVCLGFIVPDQGVVDPVTYASERYVLKKDGPLAPEDLNEQFMRRLLYTKFEGWRYEDELRCFFRLDEPDEVTGKHYYPFDQNLTLTRVIAGPLCTGEDRMRIEAAVKGYVRTPELVKARLAFRSFRVTEDKRGFSF